MEQLGHRELGHQGRPHEAIRIVIQSLHEKGLATDTIQTIFIENQKKLLNVSDLLPA